MNEISGPMEGSVRMPDKLSCDKCGVRIQDAVGTQFFRQLGELDIWLCNPCHDKHSKKLDDQYFEDNGLEFEPAPRIEGLMDVDGEIEYSGQGLSMEKFSMARNALNDQERSQMKSDVMNLIASNVLLWQTVEDLEKEIKKLKRMMRWRARQ